MADSELDQAGLERYMKNWDAAYDIALNHVMSGRMPMTDFSKEPHGTMCGYRGGYLNALEALHPKGKNKTGIRPSDYSSGKYIVATDLGNSVYKGEPVSKR
ncbi:MAG: hypothetical protein AABW79_02700 [Nanoarchaeota archaeon]